MFLIQTEQAQQQKSFVDLIPSDSLQLSDSWRMPCNNCEKRRHLPPRIGYLVSATVNAVMAELVEHYYGRHMDRWEIIRGNPEGDEAREIAYIFWSDEEIALLDTDHWLQVADSIESHLRRQFRQD